MKRLVTDAWTVAQVVYILLWLAIAVWAGMD
jgi:hypothetical protein